MEEMNLGSNCCRKLRAQERERERERRKEKDLFSCLKFSCLHTGWCVCFGSAGWFLSGSFFFSLDLINSAFECCTKVSVASFFLLASNMQQLIVVRRIFFFTQRETEGEKKWERKNQPKLMNFILDVLKQRITKSVKREREREHTHTPRDRERIKIV